MPHLYKAWLYQPLPLGQSVSYWEVTALKHQFGLLSSPTTCLHGFFPRPGRTSASVWNVSLNLRWHWAPLQFASTKLRFSHPWHPSSNVFSAWLLVPPSVRVVLFFTIFHHRWMISKDKDGCGWTKTPPNLNKQTSKQTPHPILINKQANKHPTQS